MALLFYGLHFRLLRACDCNKDVIVIRQFTSVAIRPELINGLAALTIDQKKKKISVVAKRLMR